MKYPDFLNKNNSIKYITPSFSCSNEPYKSRLLKSISNIEDLGYHVLLSNTNFSEVLYNKEYKYERASEFMTSYQDISSQMLLSVGGGEFMTEILDEIDFDIIKNSKPKWFMGYSDNTNLTFLLTTICDVATIYGPCAPEFGSNYLEESQTDCFKLLSGEKLILKGYSKYEKESLKNENNPFLNYNLTEDKILTLFPNDNASFSGRLIGGCLDVLPSFLGTKYDNVLNFIKKYQDDKIIWFLEACELNVVSVKRTLLQLERAGWFNNVSGFIFGRPLNTDTLYGISQYTCITDILAKYNVPIIMDTDIGHLKPMIPIICGSYANISATEENIEIEMILK